MRTLALLFTLILWPTTAPAAELCVENASDAVGFFVSHPDGGPRVGGTLGPGARLCADGPGPMGTVAVFAAETDFEGCSRRVPVGVTEQLIAFPHVDLCTWRRAE